MIDSISWPDDGLVPCVIQDDETSAVLMVGYMNAEALDRTRETGEVHFWSRSRQQLWHKGGTSGHIQKVRSIAINCDQNSFLIRVEQVGAVCHDGYATCYYRDLLEDGSLAVNQERLFDPRDVYGDGFGLAGLTRQWWAAYEYLRENDLTAESGTSRLLHSPGTGALERIQDEMLELAGVMDGSHRHGDAESDLLLEGSQCCYWIVITSLQHGLTWHDVRPDRGLDVTEASVDTEMASAVLRAGSRALTTFSASIAMHLLQLVAESARTMNIEPRKLIERDLAELRERPYMAAFFNR